MIFKTALVICLVYLITAFGVDAQRDARRRTGRRKPTTELPPSPEIEPELEKSPQKLDSEIETFSKPDSIDAADPENHAITPIAKDKDNTNNGNQSGPPFIVPRGSRKPRPTPMRNSSLGRPRPTLPTFTRKLSGRTNKVERKDVKKNEDNGVNAATFSTTTTKPNRGSRRFNSGQQTPPRGSVDSNKSSNKEESPRSGISTEAPPKKRFGGGSRRPSRGSRRSTTAAPESE